MRRKDRKKRKKLGIFLIILVVLLLGGIYSYFKFTYLTYIESGLNFEINQSISSELSNLVTGGKWTDPIDKVGDLKEYYEKAHAANSSVIGWIFVDGTNINYPINHGNTDEYYLKHNWRGEPYWNGSIFLDQQNETFQNVSLINGHNMLNGIMFSQLMNFRNKDFFDGNHNIYIYNGVSGQREEFKPIAALYCEPTIDLTLGNLSNDDKSKEVDRLMAMSMYPKQTYNGNNVLLLNTCLSNGTGRHLLLVTEQIA